MQNMSPNIGYDPDITSVASDVLPSMQPEPVPGEPSTSMPLVTPMVYVKEDTRWEYRVEVRPLTGNGLMTAHDLNLMGAAGWELVGIVTVTDQAYYYCKRLAA